MKVLLGSIVGALLLLFVYGAVLGAIDASTGKAPAEAKEGAKVDQDSKAIKYKIKSDCMEPVSGLGYKLYFKLFTDVPKKAEELEKTIREGSEELKKELKATHSNLEEAKAENPS